MNNGSNTCIDADKNVSKPGKDVTNQLWYEKQLTNPKKILVVDDDASIRSALAAVLCDEGYIVDLASTGKDAVKKTESTVYNLVLLDIRLPDMEGVEVLTKMHDTVPKTRKIMLTGFPSQQNAISSLNNKADVYLIKPVDVEELLGAIRKELRYQEDEIRFSQQKINEFIKTRVKELQKSNPC